MRLLLDCDVLIDVALNRNPHADAAAALLDTLELRPGSAFVAWHTISNFYYLVSPERGSGDTRLFVLDLSRFVSVSPTTTESLKIATQLHMKDFEDAMQAAAALACKADFIVTRNLRDFANAPIPAIDPPAATLELGV